MKSQYPLKVTRHVKIWFSRYPSVWMTKLNKERLIQHRNARPKDTITLVSDKKMLNQVAAKEMERFCQQHNIKYIDIKDLEGAIENLPEQYRENEKKILAIAKQELAYSKYITGCLAVASDLLRTLRVVLRHGMYSDTDCLVYDEQYGYSVEPHVRVFKEDFSLKKHSSIKQHPQSKKC